MEVRLPFAKAQSHFRALDNQPLFDGPAQLGYRRAVATAAGVSTSVVRIRSITAVAGGVTVDTLIRVPAVPPSLDILNLNRQLVAQGLAEGVMLGAPKVILIQGMPPCKPGSIRPPRPWNQIPRPCAKHPPGPLPPPQTKVTNRKHASLYIT